MAWRSWTLTGSSHGLEAEVVGGAVDRAALDAAAGQPDGEAVVVVVAAELRLAVAVELDGRRPAELAAPDDQRVVEHPALLEVGQQGGDRPVDLAGQLAVVRLDLGVVVPGLAGAVPELDVADAALQQPAGDQGLPAVDAGAVQVADRLAARGRRRRRRRPRSASGRPARTTGCGPRAGRRADCSLVLGVERRAAGRAAGAGSAGEACGLRMFSISLSSSVCWGSMNVPW